MATQLKLRPGDLVYYMLTGFEYEVLSADDIGQVAVLLSSRERVIAPYDFCEPVTPRELPLCG